MTSTLKRREKALQDNCEMLEYQVDDPVCVQILGTAVRTMKGVR